METKHYRLKHGWDVSELDKRALFAWVIGACTAQEAMHSIRINNENPEMFLNEQEFVDWANSLGWFYGDISGLMRFKNDRNQKDD